MGVVTVVGAVVALSVLDTTGENDATGQRQVTVGTFDGSTYELFVDGEIRLYYTAFDGEEVAVITRAVG